ncbi:conserved hypothetical protein [Ricinus communis]|uniref:Uncharacterized protein n=1 Tax=Ricinus communis TaxID=3988 RepID=B9SXT5_RICCO|nr:conserved hypothetical protein [Ricinus communis]
MVGMEILLANLFCNIQLQKPCMIRDNQQAGEEKKDKRERDREISAGKRMGNFDSSGKSKDNII